MSGQNLAIRRCDADVLQRMLLGTAEVSVLDVRELTHFGHSNILWSANLPFGRLELEIAARVPRTNTPVVLVDAGDGLATRAANKLESLGYTDLWILAGGVDAWRRAGHTLHWETEVAVKGFAGFAERCGSPSLIEPETLHRHLSAGDNWTVLDSRPPDEYRRTNIPGSIDAPGAQALRSFFDLVPDPTTEVVINCATRTRGILGALMLQAAGVPNRVHVLRNGTRGWNLAGFELETHAMRMAATPSERAREQAQRQIAGMLNQVGIERISTAELERMRADSQRTTYLIDVRDPEEFEAGHLADAVNAAFGSLIMSPEGYFATLGSRVVLIDDDGIRAGVSAVWLAQIGACTPFVLDGGADQRDLVVGAQARIVLGMDNTRVESVSAGALMPLLEQGQALVIDLSSSDQYLRGHIPGALWCLRTELPERLAALDATKRHIVLTAQEPEMAVLAAPEVHQLSDVTVRVLEDGNRGWRQAGLPVVTEPAQLLSEPVDRWLQSSDRPNPQQAQRDYLDWETALLQLIEQGDPVRYRNLLWR